MKKVLFVDRDGTIIREPEDKQVDSLEKLMFIPGSITGLSAIARETDFELVMVTNQDGLGTPSFPENDFSLVQDKMLEILKGEGVVFSEIFVDSTFPEQNAPTRKPGIALLAGYLASGIDLSNSYVIGDRVTDIQLARNLGCNAIYYGKDRFSDTVLSTGDWNEIYKFLKSKPRKASVARKTNETDISIEINIDGSGKNEISTGIGFFDHMLDQVARHGNIDVRISAKGDIETDAHHLIEDVAITLGEAFSRALGGKKGIERFGFVLPMDDSLAQVAVDLGGRPWLVWDAEFRNAMIGEMPSEMVFHFFKSFSDNAGCNLNIKATGSNDHHKAEAIFKAFAKALGNAARQTNNYNLPTTKGKL